MADKVPDIRKVYNPDQEELDRIHFVYDRKRAMEDAPMRKDAERQWNKADDQWESLRKTREKDSWQSNHEVPLTQSVVETAMSEYVGQFPRPFLVPRGTEDVAKVGVAQKIFDYSYEIADGEVNEHDVIKSGLIRGTAIAQEYYWQDKRMIQELDKDGKSSEKEMIDFDGCYMENVKLEDFLVDEFARSFIGTYAARDCIRRYIMNIDDVQRMFSGPIWDQFGNVKNGFVKPGGDVNYYEWYKPPQGMDTSKQVEVLWYWSVKPKDSLTIVINDVLVRDGPNPYKHKRLPFARAIAIKRLNSFYGKGLAEVLESTEDETETLRRMIIDRNHLDIDKMFLVSNRLGLSDEDLIARPHGMIPTDDVTGAKAVEYGDIPRSVEISLKHLEDDATISTGVNPRAQALPTAGTATEAAILKESTLKRLQLMIWLFKYEFLIPWARLRISNILQYYSQPKLEKIIGDKATAEYQAEVAKAQASGSLVSMGGQDFKQTYPSIRLENKAIDFNAVGAPKEVPATGFTFFEAKPQYFMTDLGYDVKFLAGATLQISKPLQQAKDLEWADRMLNIALTVPGSYDPVKIGDVITRAYDKDPNALKPDQKIQTDSDARLQMQLALASMEIKQMMQGKVVPPTPNASPVHTRMIVEFMNSDEFQKLPNDSPIIQVFSDHVVGEIGAQEMRQGNMGMEKQPAEEVPPTAPRTGRTSISQGITNKKGGMAKPSTKLEQVLPVYNSGGNKSV